MNNPMFSKLKIYGPWFDFDRCVSLTETEPLTFVWLLMFLLKFGASNLVASLRLYPFLRFHSNFSLFPSSLCFNLPCFLLHKLSNDRRNLCNFTSQLLPKRLRFVFQLRSLDWSRAPARTCHCMKAE